MSNQTKLTLQIVLAKIQDVTEFLGIELTDVNQRGIFGDTPLHVTAVWGDAQAAKVLIEAGADVGAKGERQDTPLHHAVAQGHPEVVKLLVENGARTDVRNADGETPLDFAISHRNNEIVEILNRGRSQ
ncbi:MAG: ankyrin repeat domain-containing protein [Sulfuricaulis sp.]